MKRHLIITGTGRAGTSLLVRYLAECGLETHLSTRNNELWDEAANAGLEDIPVWQDSSPYVAKSPWLFEFIDDLLARSDIRIDGVIIPVRDLGEAAASRAILELRARHAQVEPREDLRTWETWGLTPGGTLYSIHPIDQARILAVGFHKVVQQLVKHDIPITFLDFPRLVRDGEYLYEKLSPFLPANVDRAAALAAHRKLADPEKVRVSAEVAVAAGEKRTTGDGRIVQPTVQYPAFPVVEAASLKREVARLRSELREKIDSMTAERAAIAAQCDRVRAEMRALTAERDGLAADRSALTLECDVLRGKLARVKKLSGWELIPSKIRAILSRALRDGR